MLDTETKRRIDTARDILVGKVPDPKSQVEQITIALIYKFMDDMDAQAEELGGTRAFFAGEFEKYSWAKLMRVGMGGFEVLNLYAEAITRMTQNANLPLLFRDIFKNAYLPYRDPETLKQFLKTINEFSYDHSERLGDAFEYLLSVLGSQGDAGQFRTPRHIIDFMVALLEPQKNETVLDPACGTAGFLISAYKYILNANARDGRPGGALTPDERARLVNQIKGYDISPDMVRLSLVNLYLHGFTNPHIVEYDTLTSEDKWNEHADIIMANPPFMSPKGGIRPHKRFSVQSNRSEVLFVDYIAEHLAANGRAAVIVPEGIIFQSGNAYKALRKMLVENYLVGVISLPAGVFNPYSGVKTSILWLDKALAKKTDEIIFVKIENDGFDLGAQRRESKQNDLPAALENLRAYKRALGETRRVFSPNDGVENPSGLLVEKARIAENGDYGLSGERYRKQEIGVRTKFPLVEIGGICTFEYGKALKQEDRAGGEYPVFGSNGIVGYHNEFIVQAPFLVVGRKGSAGEVHYSDKNGYPIDTTFYIKLENENKIALKFLFHILKSLDLKSVNTQAGVPGLNRNDAYKMKIPLPPLAVQQEIVAEIEGYQKIIDGARQVVESYQPRIEIDAEWEMVRLGEVCEINPKKTEVSEISKEVVVSFVPMADLNENEMDFDARQEKPIGEVLQSYTYFRDNDVLLARVTPCFENGKAGIAKNLKSGIGFGSSEYYVFRPNGRILSLWIYLNVITQHFRDAGVRRMTGTGGLQRVPKDFVESWQIPLPALATQTRIVARIEREQQLVAANRELIEMFEEKIRERVARVWGERLDREIGK